MSKFKKFQINWKYIVGETLLIFMGISLAIWFNNWNSARQTDQNKEIAITKIEGEIKSNLEELIESRKVNSRVKLAIEDYEKMQVAEVGTVATPLEIAAFQKDYPGFFTTADSIQYDGNRFVYDGDTYIGLELSTLPEIAWETAKATGITGAFGFECLYQLEAMYNVQRLVQAEMIKAALALQEGDIERLVKVLDFINQLDSQLEEDYKNALVSIKNCN